MNFVLSQWGGDDNDDDGVKVVSHGCLSHVFIDTLRNIKVVFGKFYGREDSTLNIMESLEHL